MRVFEVVDVVQKQREENAGDDARDDRRRGRESDAVFASSSSFSAMRKTKRTLKGAYSTLFSLSVFLRACDDDDAPSLSL